MDLGKYRRDRFGRIPAISDAAGDLRVQRYREIRRTRGDFARFSAMSVNRETGWWMTQSAANPSLVPDTLAALDKALPRPIRLE
jgi:hypothetical protein